MCRIRRLHLTIKEQGWFQESSTTPWAAWRYSMAPLSRKKLSFRTLMERKIRRVFQTRQTLGVQARLNCARHKRSTKWFTTSGISIGSPCKHTSSRLCIRASKGREVGIRGRVLPVTCWLVNLLDWLPQQMTTREKTSSLMWMSKLQSDLNLAAINCCSKCGECPAKSRPIWFSWRQCHNTHRHSHSMSANSMMCVVFQIEVLLSRHP